jgi:hypothetical protein
VVDADDRQGGAWTSDDDESSCVASEDIDEISAHPRPEVVRAHEPTIVMHLGGITREPRTRILHAHEIEQREAIVAGFDQQIDVAWCRCMVSRERAVEEKTCNTEASKARAVVP